jgi:CRISPR-associated protein Csd1
MIMGLNAATPGRLSVVLYRELAESDFIEALEHWHNGMVWYYVYFDKNTKKLIRTISSPSPQQIAQTAYGERVKNDRIENTVERLMPCILDKKPIPVDIERQCCSTVSNLLVIGKDEKTTYIRDYKRESMLETACAVFKYNALVKQKEEYKVALEKDRTTRDYLYGRLLAVADEFEKSALKEMGTDRETNALRYMQRFSRYPAATWKMLYEKLLPYKKHAKFAQRYENLIGEITNLFEHDDYVCDKPLSGEYLLGYQCQKKDLYIKQEKETTTEEK